MATARMLLACALLACVPLGSMAQLARMGTRSLAPAAPVVSPPVILAVRPGNTAVAIEFQPPVIPGSMQISGYVATCSPVRQTVDAITHTQAAVPEFVSDSGVAVITVNNLVNGAYYTCSLQADIVDPSKPLLSSERSAKSAPSAPSPSFAPSEAGAGGQPPAALLAHSPRRRHARCRSIGPVCPAIGALGQPRAALL